MRIGKYLVGIVIVFIVAVSIYFAFIGNDAASTIANETVEIDKNSVDDFSDKFSFKSYLEMSDVEREAALNAMINGTAQNSSITNVNISGDVQKILSMPEEGADGILSLMSNGVVTTKKEATAKSNMSMWGSNTTTISVPIWKMNTKTGEKSQSQMSITCNKYIACVWQEAFEQIFADPSKPPIENGGTYVRKVNGSNGSKASIHALGAAIDINVDWNPCYYSNGKIVRSADKWNCKGAVVPYSVWNSSAVSKVDKEMCLYEGCPIVTILKAHGFTWGAEFNYNGGGGDRMHFSFVGER